MLLRQNVTLWLHTVKVKILSGLLCKKGGEDAARAVGADFEYIFNPSGDMGDMAKSITAAAATQPDGIVVSLPDPDALGGAIKAAVAAGIPVITMNSGLESSKEVGALMHVGQPEFRQVSPLVHGRKPKAQPKPFALFRKLTTQR